MKAVVSLTPSASRRLIARGMANLPEIIKARTDGTIIIANGITNAFVAEELAGIDISQKLHYTAGLITDEGLTVSPAETRMSPIVLTRGARTDRPWLDALGDLEAGDVFVKGANAIDLDGNAGILLGRSDGGTIGQAAGTLAARGITVIVPAGLEKLIPSVPAAARAIGTTRVDASTGMKVGMMVLTTAVIITELEAVSLLSNCLATAIAAGGVSGGEGSVVIGIEGDERDVRDLLEQIEEMRSEPPLKW